ncbi:hypothetical protein L9F63_010693, partial [Diploptera punctata]
VNFLRLDSRKVSKLNNKLNLKLVFLGNCLSDKLMVYTLILHVLPSVGKLLFFVRNPIIRLKKSVPGKNINFKVNSIISLFEFLDIMDEISFRYMYYSLLFNLVRISIIIMDTLYLLLIMFIQIAHCSFLLFSFLL